MIITASIVGSGELILTTKLGAEVGFTLLWFIILGCVIKVFVQVELGRYAICAGATTLEAMDRMPGPRAAVSWLVWLWLLMYTAVLFQVSGIVGSVAALFASQQHPHLHVLCVIVAASSCALFLVFGRYRLVELLSTLMVFLFTFSTVLAVGALQWTDYRISMTQLAAGMNFRLPDELTTAFGAFGITGVGASELVYYPYWCMEKGYARFVGPREDTAEWRAGAEGWIRVMRLDAWFSMLVYTTATVAFYLLGAAVLHARGLVVEDDRLVDTLSHMYRESYGPVGLWIFLIGAFNVLYSTLFVSTASNSRLFADALSLFGIVRYRSEAGRRRVVKLACGLIPIVGAALYIWWRTPVSLVFVGALAQALMLPFLALCALDLRHRRTDSRLQPGAVWTTCLWSAFLLMAAFGAYKLWEAAGRILKALSR